MELKLKRPIVFIDLETTGINVSSDRIVEISALKIHPNGKEQWLNTRVNPEMPIPEKATEIHGISDKDVAGSPTFKEIAKNIAVFLEGCDLAGYNAIKFDIPVLAEEFLRVNLDFNFRKRRYVDPQVIFYKKEQRTLAAAYQFYCKKTLENAHSAQADTSATYEVLKAQLDTYSDLENDVEKLSAFSAFNENVDFAGRIIMNEKGVEVFNFGKHKGRPVEDVFKEDPAYYSWMMNGDFPLYTKKVLTEIKLRTFGKKDK
ncbi:MAG: 3'-5' exonuclease [Bacteroidales bacterium]|nr:3'-5' exonuclease [Bacteroidales bacterium]OQB63709.1 MAG: DNA polymerase III PolC-type [Bacteroidetes bacterium ADurb.Bin145]HOU01324.1 3'-5' exonuclease [Bacteroidales bacterium]HQK67407.1 3'-5' exonuclease [Bacteroidales bacterium]